MNNEKNSLIKNLRDMRSLTSIILALILVISSVSYIVYRTISNKAYNEKWKDYDECGLS